MSARTQSAVLWWSIALGVLYAIVFVWLLHLVPPPRAEWDVDRVGQYYREHTTSILWGAVIGSVSGGFLVPFWTIVSLQISRLEHGKLWARLAFGGGIMMSVFIALPPLFFGVAAWDPSRPADITALMHEMAMLTVVTTAQYYIFGWVAIVGASLKSTQVKHSPFPRWYGYFTAWSLLPFEMGIFAFIPHTGLFAWNGLLAFWIPVAVFGLWLPTTFYLLLRALKAQRLEEQLLGEARTGDTQFTGSAA